MLSIPADFPFFSDATAASTSLRRIECKSFSELACYQSSTAGLLLSWWLYSSEQSSIHLFSTSFSSCRQLPVLSWIQVGLPCFFVVRSLTTWYAFPVLFLFMFSLMSISRCLIQVSFAFLISSLTLLFASLGHLFSFSVLDVRHIDLKFHL